MCIPIEANCDGETVSYLHGVASRISSTYLLVGVRKYSNVIVRVGSENLQAVTLASI